MQEVYLKQCEENTHSGKVQIPKNIYIYIFRQSSKILWRTSQMPCWFTTLTASLSKAEIILEGRWKAAKDIMTCHSNK